MVTLKSLCERVRVTVKFGAPENLEFEGSTGYTVTLRYKGRQMTVPFYMGAAHTSEPTAYDVMSCLLSDTASVDNAKSFEEWARDLGFEEDSRRAERIFKASERISEKIHNLLREEFNTWVWAEE